jgi:hypothetical protein
MKCRFCQRETQTTINDYCYQCYYGWFGFPLTDKILMSLQIFLCSTILIICIQMGKHI